MILHRVYCPKRLPPPPDSGGSSWLCCCDYEAGPVPRLPGVRSEAEKVGGASDLRVEKAKKP